MEHDLGWMLFTGQALGMHSGQARELGIFWLRRATERNHTYAKWRLEERGLSLSESRPRTIEDVLHADSVWAALSMLVQIVQGRTGL